MLYSAAFLPCLRFAFVGVLLIFFLSWFARKVLDVIRAWRKAGENKQENDTSQREAGYSVKQNAWKQNIQELYCVKAAAYKEKIQIPREREKRERKEKEFHRLLGPVWQGEGTKLGGDDYSSSDNNDNDTSHPNESTRAARRRKIPEPDPPKVKTIKPNMKSKRVIELPEEPNETDPESLLITMRTPIGTLVRRRFCLHHSFQNVLDFMTKSGFSQLRYQLCTSYPRQALSPEPEVLLSDLGFGKRITLNIEDNEDKDLS